MNLLYIMYRFPFPLDKGDKLRAYNQIKYLSKKHNVYLCCILDEKLQDNTYQELVPYCKEIFTFKIPKPKLYFNAAINLVTCKPIQNSYAYDGHVDSIVKRIIDEKKIDHAICLMVRPAKYLIGLNIPTTLDYQDVLSVGFARRAESLGFLKKLIYTFESKRLAEYEKQVFDLFTNKVIITNEDKSLIPHPKRNQIKVIGNGIDLNFFRKDNSPKIFDLLFVGNMQYEPNIVSMIYMVNEVLPLIQSKLPNVKLMIAGADPTAEIRALARENVTITGRLDDIRTAYKQGKVFVAPMLIGTGLQNKLLEAMAMGLPIVTSDLCNKGLKANEGEHLLVGYKAQEYADHCIALLENPLSANEMAERAFQFVKSNYSWDAINSELEKIISNSSR